MRDRDLTRTCSRARFGAKLRRRADSIEAGKPFTIQVAGERLRIPARAQVASLLDERLAPAGAIVAVQARHLCTEMRGVSKPGVLTTTTAVRGGLQDASLQQKFFAQVRDAAGASSFREV